MNARDPWMRRTVAVSVLALLPMLAVAADRSPKATSAEKTPAAVGEVAAARTAKLLPRLTAEEKALAAIQEEGRARVAALAAELRAASSDGERQSLNRRIVALKTEYRVRFLETLQDFARQRGDEPTARAAARAIEQLLYPEKLRATAVPPAASEPAPGKGGRP